MQAGSKRASNPWERDVPRVYQKKPKADRGLVRCLGPGEEHTFDSPDPTHIRVCPDCRKKLDRAPRMFLDPIVVTVIDPRVNRRKGEAAQ